MTRKTRAYCRISETRAYCRICGAEPMAETPSNILCRFWDPDDGWIFGALCPYCHAEYEHAQPQPGDYAYEDQYGSDAVQTDEDVTDLF